MHRPHQLIAVLMVGLSLLWPAAVPAQTGTVVPIVQEIAELADGTLRVVFGYINTGDEIRTIQFGLSNFFMPDPALRREAPTVFFPGQNDRVFATTLAAGEDSLV